jgi:hypothetical protein
VYVILAADQDDASHDQGTDQAERDGDPRDELVAELRDRGRALEEANRENRRIIAGLVQRVPAIEGDSSEASGAPQTASEGTGRGDPGVTGALRAAFLAVSVLLRGVSIIHDQRGQLGDS